MNKKITILTIGILIFFGMLFFIQPTNAYLDFEIYTASSTAEEFGWVGAGDITNLEQYLKLKEEGFKFKGQSYLFLGIYKIIKRS